MSAEPTQKKKKEERKWQGLKIGTISMASVAAFSVWTVTDEGFYELFKNTEY